jgi:hypothetical protein
MCFSASGSFAAAGLLGAVGSVALARNSSVNYRMFSAIPVLFAVQQAAEGVVWLTMGRPDQSGLQQRAVLLFLGFALLVWPVWLPLSLVRIEQQPGRRWVLQGFCWLGAGVAAYATVLLLRWQPMAETAGHSIRYVYSTGSYGWYPGVYLAGYALPTVVPLFVSSARMSRILGTALILSLASAMVIERDALTSVWCFFAALLSGLVLLAVSRERHCNEAAAVAA